jgi:membrane protein YfhO
LLRPTLPRRELLLAVAFVALWILPPFWGIATLQTVNVQDDIFASDLWNDRLPARAFVGASLRRGEPPTWMPGIYTGFPSLAQVEVGALYPSNVALFSLLPPYVAIAWAQLLPLAIAGVGAFVLAAEIGLPLESRLLAAGAFSLCGFLVVHLRQLNMVDAAAWLPWLLATTERIAARRPGRAPLALALLWAVELLAGHPQISYYAGLFLVAYFAARRWQLRREVAPRLFVRDAALAIGLPVTLGTLAAAAQLVPAAELARLTYREGGLGFADSTKYAVSPLNVWTFFAPGLFGDARDDSFRLSGLFWEQYGYVGLSTIVLAIVGVVVARRSAHVRVFAVATVVSYLLVLGRNTPLYGWAFAIVPGMAYFRFPTRFLLFTEVGVVLLAGFGLAACCAALPARGRKAAALLVLALTATDLWFHQGRQVPQVERNRWLAPIDSVRALTRAREASPEPWRYYALDASVVHGQLYHAAHGYGGDLTPFLQLRALLQPSFNLLFGLEAPDGYSNLVPRHYEAVWGSEKKRGAVPARHLETGEIEAELVQLLRLFNVRYVLSVLPARSAALRHVERTAEGVDVYEVDGALPRAFVVGELVRVGGDEEAIARLVSPSFDASRQAVVEGDALALPPGAAASRDVEVRSRRNDEVLLHASLAEPGLLVLSEGYYPGWQATIDGEPAPIHRVNVMMRGVVLPAGEHDVAFRFRSRTIRAGALVSLAALLALALARRRLVLETTTPEACG